MSSSSRPWITRADRVFAVTFLISLAGLSLVSYLDNFHGGDGILGMLCWVGLFLIGATAGLSLLVSPFTGHRMDFRGGQFLLRLALLAGMAVASCLLWILPNASLIGHHHRVASFSQPEDWRTCADWLIRSRDEGKDISSEWASDLLELPEAAKFAANWKAWDKPTAICVSGPGEETRVSFSWGSGHGHWGVMVGPEVEGEAAGGVYYESRRWAGDVWIWMSD